MMDWKNFKKPCIMHQDDEYGKNVLDGFTQQLDAMKVQPASITSYKRGASDFSAQIAKMKSDGCDLVVLGTIIRETIGAMSEARKLGWDVTFLGATPTNVLEVPTLGKDAVEGLYAASGFEFPMRIPPPARSKSGWRATRRCSAPRPIRRQSSATMRWKPLPFTRKRPART